MSSREDRLGAGVKVHLIGGGNPRQFFYEWSLLGFEEHCIHSSPAIRGEDQYRGVDVALRRKLLMKFLAFIHHGDLRFKCFFAKKTPTMREEELLTALRSEIDPFVDANYRVLSSYGQLTIAYDKGQKQISELITATLERRFDNVRVTKILPVHSRLSQVADFACTMKRIAYKLQVLGAMSKSEAVFFGGVKNFKQFWLKALLKTEWK